MKASRMGIACAVAAVAVGATASAAGADVIGATFERPLYTPNDIHEQQGWLNSRHNDARVVINDKSFPGVSAFFGAQSLQLSNRFARDPLLDQTVSPSLIDGAGEETSEGAGFSGGVRQPQLDIRFKFTAAVPDFQQDLEVAVSPTRGDARVAGNDGDGSRMGLLRLRDTAMGLAVDSEDAKADGTMQSRVIASGLARDKVHAVHQVVYFNDDAPDEVETYIDGELVDTGTTWESAYRAAHKPVPTSDALMFAMVGRYNQALHHEGFLVDDVRLESSGNPEPEQGPKGDSGTTGQTGSTGSTGATGAAGTTTVVQAPAAEVKGSSVKVFSVVLSDLKVRLGAHPMARVTAKCPTNAVLCDGVLRVFAGSNKVAVRRAYALTSGQKVRMNIPLSKVAAKRIAASKGRMVKVSAYTRDRDGRIVRASLSRKASEK